MGTQIAPRHDIAADVAVLGRCPVRAVGLIATYVKTQSGRLPQVDEAALRPGVHYADGPRDAYVFSPDPAGAVPWNPDTMTHRYWKYADRVGITSSLKEARHYSATQLLTAGVDLKTVAGRLGHAEASATLRFYAQFTRPADQHAATAFPKQLDGFRKRDRLRDLYRAHADDGQDLAALAAVLGAKAGLEPETAPPMLASFAAQGVQRAG